MGDTPTPNVTVNDVRTALQEIDAEAIPDATIQAAIDDNELIVDSRLPTDWQASNAVSLPDDYGDMTDAEQLEWRQRRVNLITKHMAKRQAFNSSGAEVRAQALDAVVSLDIQAFRGQLRRDVEQAWETLGWHDGSTTTPFVDATGHAPTGGTKRRDDRRGQRNF